MRSRSILRAALTVGLLSVPTCSDAQPAAGNARAAESAIQNGGLPAGLSRIGAVKLGPDGKVKTMEAYEQAIAATNRSRTIKFYGTTGRYEVDYDAVLNDALRNIPTYNGPPALPGALRDAVTPGLRLGSDPRTQMPSTPDGTVVVLQAKLAEAENACAAGSAGSCKAEASLNATITDVKIAIKAHPDCTSAVARYVPFYPNLGAPEDRVAAFDRECLGSTEPRSTGQGFVRDTLPPILSGLSTSATQRTPIAILEVKGGKPFCGALIRNDHTLVTARHCFDDAAEAWKAGMVTVRPIDGRGGPWAIEPKFLKEGGGSTTTQTDWAVIRILTPDQINATDVPLTPASGPAPAMVMAYFQEHEAVGYGPGQSSEDWRRGLRWARPGFCSIEDVPPGCVRLLCQTVEGFSGAPIFATEGGRTVVVGFVSRAAVADGASCGPRTSYVTVAVSSQAAF